MTSGRGQLVARYWVTAIDRERDGLPYDLRGIALSLSCILVFSESERGHTCSSAFACRWLNLARLGLSLSLAFAHFAPNLGDEKLERKVRPLVGLGDTPIGDGTRMKLEPRLPPARALAQLHGW